MVDTDGMISDARASRGFLIMALLSLSPINRLQAETIQLLPSEDTTLFEFDPTFNYGEQHVFISGTLGPQGDLSLSRALLKFDIAQNVPPGKVIESASLDVYVTDAPPESNRVDSTFHLRRMLTPWAEGKKSSSARPGGAPADPDESNWRFTGLTNQRWATPGGAPGDDYLDLSSGSTRIRDRRETYRLELNERGLADLVLWQTEPTRNFGWILISEREDKPFTARRFGASENQTEARRPVLNITFGPVNDPPSLTVLRIDPSTLEITVEGQAGQTCTLQTADTLASPTWLNLDSFQLPETGLISTTMTIRDDTNTTFFRATLMAP